MERSIESQKRPFDGPGNERQQQRKIYKLLVYETVVASGVDDAKKER